MYFLKEHFPFCFTMMFLMLYLLKVKMLMKTDLGTIESEVSLCNNGVHQKYTQTNEEILEVLEIGALSRDYLHDFRDDSWKHAIPIR